ncbi:hypothetical protein GRAN_2493 [Granulicella sibirica]|uniref:Uncharacterized protein n=2 Tax=Granulicella sibirica TaxID=2479048 RepID=A0A4Q0T2D0_9BACT|nr:hypothetical protein GRAN_2493 [Granulicella sibirica]
MRHFFPTRAVFLLAGLPLSGLGMGAAWAQNASSLPVNAPTGVQILSTGTAGPVAAPTTSHKADVDYTGGLLHISANNSSLNQILREVSRLTGMKITGGVAEDRVFGTYGPAPASAVLTSLLDGTSSNVLIVQNAAAGPAELILTPRKGEPTPPNPNGVPGDDDPARDLPQQANDGPPQHPPGGRMGQPRRSLAPSGLGPLPTSNGGQTGTPIDGGADIGQTPGAFTPAGETPPDVTAQPATDPAPSAAPEDQPDATRSPAAATPQQIYEQLQRLRSQQTPVPE